MPAGPTLVISRPRRFGGGRCPPSPCLTCFSLIWVFVSAAPTPQKIALEAMPSSVSRIISSGSNNTSYNGGTGSNLKPVPSLPSNSTKHTIPHTINADDVIGEVNSTSRGKRSGGGGDGSRFEVNDVEGVYQSTLVYPSPRKETPTSSSVSSRRKTVKKSYLKREGTSLLKAATTLASRTTHGVCRAVNVTGTAASVVTGGVFKLAGAAVLDVVDGMENVSGKAPIEVPGVTEAYRFLAKGLRKTGETVYDFGVAAENMTAEATEAAEETIRIVFDSVIETASGAHVGYPSYGKSKAGDYFEVEEDRIVDDMMFGMPYSAGEEHRMGGDCGTGGSDGAMVYFEGDLPTDDEWAAEGRPCRGELEQGERWQRGVTGRERMPFSGEPERRRPRKLALAARAREAIRRSILQTSRAVPTMRFPQMVACGMVFAVRGLTSNPWCTVASFFGARMYLKFIESIYLECLRERMMSDIKFEAVSRLHEGSPERARWINTALSAMWVPMLEPLLAKWISRQITRGIERSLPSNVSWVGLGKVTLGPRPPTIRYVQVRNVTSIAARKSEGQSNGIIDSVLLQADRPGGQVKGEHLVYLELGVDWTSYRSKVSLKLGEQSRRRNWWSVTSYVPSYRVKLCDLGIKAKVIVAMAVGEGRPFVKRLWVGFSEPPLTHMSLEALTGMDIANLPVLRKHLRHVVMRCLMPLTEPRYLNLEMRPLAPPPGPYRGAALAARVRPAADGVRRGVLSRVPAFGLRRLLRNKSRTAAAGEASFVAERVTDEGGGDGGDEDLPGHQEPLGGAIRRLLVDVGGDCREETVTAAVSRSMAKGKQSKLSVPVGGLSSSLTAEHHDRPLDEEERAGGRLRRPQWKPRLGDYPVADGSAAVDAEERLATDGASEQAAAAELVTSGEINAHDTAVVAKVAAAAFVDRGRCGDDEVGLRSRAEIKRCRAARREQQRDALSPGVRRRASALACVRRYWRCLPFTRRRQRYQRRFLGKGSPERDIMIRRVCSLSRPPSLGGEKKHSVLRAA